MGRLRLGLVLMAGILLTVLAAPPLWPHDPLEPDYRARYAAPSALHPLGTDGLGRDVLARSLAGGRVSLLIALSATALAAGVGTLAGVVAAEIGGAFELAAVRVFDAVLAFPGFLLVLLAVTALGGGSLQTILALGFAGSPLYFRLSRGFTRKGKTEEYVLGGRAIGASRGRLLLFYIVPGFLGPLVVQAASTSATFLLVEASLSYLGLGVPLPTPSWGNILQDARSYLTRQPWAAVGPGLFLGLAALALQLLSDGFQAAFDRRGR